MPSPVTLKIKFKSASLQQFIERYSVDVSKGGIFIRTPKPLTVGTALKFEFQLQDGNPLITGSGTVVWIREPDPEKANVAPGMGVRFDHMPPESQKVLDQVLAQKQQAMDFAEQPTRVAMSQDGPAKDDFDAPEEPSFDPKPDAPAAATPEPKPASVAGGEPEAKTEDEPPPAPEPEDSDEPEPPEDTEEPEEPEEPSGETASAAEEHEESEEERKERLAKILFSSEEEDLPKEGAKPLAEPGATSRDLPLPAPTTKEQKSSAIGWLVIVLVIALGVALYFMYLRKPETPQTPNTTPTTKDTKEAQDTKEEPPTPAGVKIKVTSTPEAAKILVDGKDTGKVTPAELEGLDPEKEIEIQIDLPGKKLFSTKIKPTPDQAVEAKLDQSSARRLQIASEPSGAAVFLNGFPVGKTPLDYKRQLDPKRKNELLFRLKGHEEQRKELTGSEPWIREGVDEALTITATLVKKGVAPAPAPAPVEPKVRPRPRPRPEPRVKPEPKPKPEPRVKPEPKPEPKPADPGVPDITPDPKPKPKPEPKPEPVEKKPEVKSPSWMD